MDTGNLTTGKVATTYLSKFHRVYLDKAINDQGIIHAHYVRLAIFEKLVREGYMPEVDLERERQKVAHRKEHPHGNTKRTPEQLREAAQAVETPNQTRARMRAERRRKLQGGV
jgi:hypothetical protein